MTMRVCACGHPRDLHRHFRAGTDCGECGAQLCPRYRGPVGVRIDVIRSIVTRSSHRPPGQRRRNNLRLISG